MAAPNSYGHFAGQVVLRFDPKKYPNVAMLHESMAYHDSKGDVWLCPAGSVVDGASIPRLFWRLVGSPYRGRYVRASVMHDVACQQREGTGRPSWRTHWAFWEAMRTDGTGPVAAWVMWAAVRMFGPRWR